MTTSATCGGYRAFERLARTGRDVDALLRGASEIAREELGLEGAVVHRLPPDEPPPVAEPPAVAVPLGGSESCIGVLSGVLAAPSPDRLAALGAFAALLAALLEQALERERLQRLDDLKSQFVALAAHELRAPVSVIHGIGATLNARGGALAADEVVRLHAILSEHTEHLARLVNQLLDLARLEANAMRLEAKEVRVRERVEEIVRAVVPEHRGAIRLDVREDLATVVDPHAFERIVSNLVTNAIRHGAPPIRIAAEQRDTHFRLSVQDAGDGVARDVVSRLFEKFARGDQTRWTGSGLGLAIAQSYANAHGGELLYEPAEPHGARFELVLPRPRG